MKRNIVASFCVLLFTSIAPVSAQVVIDLLDLATFGCRTAGADKLVDERLFQRDKEP